jgi:hypothetical protein
MGDTGSMLIGLVNAILVVKFINVSQVQPANFKIDAAPAIGFTVLMIPLLDTLRVFGIRIFFRRSPFSPDRNHVHHLLLDKGLSHRAIALTLVSLNILFVAMAYSFRSIGCTWLVITNVAIFFTGIAALHYTRQPRLFITKSMDSPLAVPELKTKIVSLTEDILEQKN